MTTEINILSWDNSNPFVYGFQRTNLYQFTLHQMGATYGIKRFTYNKSFIGDSAFTGGIYNCKKNQTKQLMIFHMNSYVFC